MRRTCVFRADASAGTGGGHIFRCAALADAVKERGWHTLLATLPSTLAAMRHVPDSFDEVVELTSGHDAEQDVAALRLRPDACVVDNYSLDTGYQTVVSRIVPRTMVFMDLGDGSHDSDIVVDVTPSQRSGRHRRLSAARTTYLLGLQYVPLRSEWRRASARRNPSDSIQHVMVSFGASDPTNATALALEGLAAARWRGRITVVLGDLAPHIDSAKEAAAKLGADFLVSPSNYEQLMGTADLVIGAAGVSTWERCCLGVPSIVLRVADNQAENIQLLRESGAAALLSNQSATSAADIAFEVDRLAENAPLRSAISAAAAALCDGLGAERIADVLCRELE